MLVLQSGQTHTDRQGYSHGDFIALIELIMLDTVNSRLEVTVNIYKSLADKQGGAKPADYKPYDIEGNQFNTVMNALKTTSQNEDVDFINAMYLLMLTTPKWATWEKA